MTVAMNHEPPPVPLPESRADPVDPRVLKAYSLVEEAGLLGGVSLELWEHLPEDFCRDHELDRGRLIRRESGSPGHQSAMVSLAALLKRAARAAVDADAYPCLRVAVDLDTRLWDVPCATVRKPDVLVYRCLEPGVTRLWASRVLLAVEIVSPSSVATDTGRDNPRSGFESKMTQYASAGIRNYWIVRLRPDDTEIASIQRFRLDEEDGVYTEVATHINHEKADPIRTDLPFPIEATWADLEF
jgi:Uma2 family endonuclease